MIEYIKGILTELNPTEAVVEAAGVGYGLAITLPTYSALVGSEEKEVKLFVSEIIREDTHEVYGFATKPERQLFDLLLTVSGVGAATARMILSAFSAEELRMLKFEKTIRLLCVGPMIVYLTAMISPVCWLFSLHSQNDTWAS